MSKDEHLTVILETVIIVLALVLTPLIFSYFRYEKPLLKEREINLKQMGDESKEINKYKIEKYN